MGANDIEASFKLKDQVSSTLSSIDRNIASAGASIEKSGGKTFKVFDKWNFGLNALKTGFRALKFAAQRDGDVGDVLNEGATALVSMVERLIYVMMPGNRTLEEFHRGIQDFARGLAQFNISEELSKVTSEVERLNATQAHIDFSNFAKKLFPDDPAKQVESVKAFNQFVGTVGDSVEHLKFLDLALKDVSSGGMALTKNQAESLWATMKKLEEETSKAKDKNDDLKDSHEAAAEAARKQKEAEDALLRTFSGGWNAAIGKLEDDFLVAGHAASRFAREAHGTISNDLFAALKGEAVSFGSFMSHILDGILRQVTDASAAGFLGLFSGGGSGGLASLFGGGGSGGGGSSPISGNRYSPYYPGNPLGPPSSAFPSYEQYADGGTVTRPTFALIGEGGESEDIVPHSKRGAYARAHGGGGSTIVQFNVNAMDAASFDAYLRANGGRAIRDHVESAIRSRSRIRGLVN